MYSELASRLAVVSGTDGFSQAVSMDGANAVQIECTLFAKGAGNVTATLQGSNDLENWDSSGITNGVVTLAGVGYATAQGTAIAYRFVRLKYTQVTSGTAILSAGINTAPL